MGTLPDLFDLYAQLKTDLFYLFTEIGFHDETCGVLTLVHTGIMKQLVCIALGFDGYSCQEDAKLVQKILAEMLALTANDVANIIADNRR